MGSGTLYRFSADSLRELDTCDPRLQRLLKEAIRYVDFSVLEGHRGKARQDALYFSEPKRSKLRWPNSKHNKTPSLAVDIAPYPIDFGDFIRFAHLIGVVRGIASQMGIPIRAGLDWDGDGELSDNRFNDYPHIEIDEKD